jgi:hypothetical protein
MKQQLIFNHPEIMADQSWADAATSAYRHTADPQLIHRAANFQPSSSQSPPQRASAPQLLTTRFSTTTLPTRSWYVFPDAGGKISLAEQPLNVPRDLRTFVRLYVGVGPYATSFDLHRDVACRHSPILKDAFKNVIRGDRMQEYHLNCPEIDETVVSLLIYWFYDPNLEANLEMDSIRFIPGKGRKTAILVKLWVLADILLIPILQNQIVMAIENLRKRENFTATFVLPYVCKNTARNSPLRALLRDQCLWELKRSWIREHPREFPTDLFVDMIEVLQVCVERRPVRDMRDYLIDVEEVLEEETAGEGTMVEEVVRKEDEGLDWGKVFPNGV